jgi:hypothetical protein
VEWWYAQNLLLFVRTDYLDSHLLLKRAFEETGASQLSIVHPEKYLILVQWIDRLYSAARDIAAAIPPGEEFILVDDDHFGGLMTGGRHIVPFLQREGQYQGPPPDDETAILETKRLRQSGASFIVFAWPAFWWFDSYRGFKQYLRSNFYCTLDNDRLVAFDMRREPNSSFSSSRL